MRRAIGAIAATRGGVLPSPAGRPLGVSGVCSTTSDTGDSPTPVRGSTA